MFARRFYPAAYFAAAYFAVGAPVATPGPGYFHHNAFPSGYFADRYFPGKDATAPTLTDVRGYFHHNAFPAPYFAHAYFPGHALIPVQPPVIEQGGGLAPPSRQWVRGVTDLVLPSFQCRATGYVLPPVPPSEQPILPPVLVPVAGSSAVALPIVTLAAVGVMHDPEPVPVRRRMTRAQQRADDDQALDAYYLALMGRESGHG